MKFLYSWLKELLPDLHDSPQDLVPILLNLGFEVEDLTVIGPAFTGVVVGEILSADKHPNADKLRLCKVTDGSATFSVVCGAPNVAAGQKVAFAKLGAKLPGGLEIRKAKIRGSESEGMICSATELGQGEGKSDGILVLPPNMISGSDYAKTLGEPDAVLDVNITPNRPDCLSHVGLAAELSLHRGLKLALPPAETPDPKASSAALEIILQDADCTAYLGRALEGLTVGPSPAWLSERLSKLGLRSINNAVDATNYLLLETGQPLHLFDLDRLSGGKIFVRAARPGEKIRALDGKEYDLSPENLVIADAARAVAIAGVMGGADSGISAGTRRAFLEVAHFAPARIRRSSRRLGLRTDSSQRFERGADPQAPGPVLRRAVALLRQLCGDGTSLGPICGKELPPGEATRIRTSPRALNGILGTSFPDPALLPFLESMSDTLLREGDHVVVCPPAERRDLKNPSDLAEEVARQFGYESIPYAMEKASLPEPPPPGDRPAAERIRAVLCGLGFSEALNYDFASPADLERTYGAPKAPAELVAVANPLSTDWTYLRPTLALGLLRSAELNFNRGAEGLRLFELGKVYAPRPGGVTETLVAAGILAGPWPPRASWKGPRAGPDLFDVKAVVEALLFPAPASWKETADVMLHPKAALEVSLGGRRLGQAGLLHPDLLRRWGLRCQSAAFFHLEVNKLPAPEAARFAPFSPFPSVSRDLSLLVDEAKAYREVEAAARSAAGADLARLELIDTFAGKGVPEGKKSLTLRLTFSRMDRTLRDEEVAAAVEKAVKALERLGAALRG